MYYGAIKKSDISNGEGIRTSLFVSGCRNACKNCFNRETWAFDYGEPFTEKTAEEISLLCEKCYEADITLKSSGADAYTVLENLILYI